MRAQPEEHEMMDPMPRGYRSDAEYSFDEKHEDAIVQVTTYCRKEFHESVIWFPSQVHDSIRPLIATPFSRTSSAALGGLERLPPELVHEVMLCLDMQSLFSLRKSSLRLRQMVDSVYQYRLVASHGLNLFCALLRTRLADCVSLFDFHSALCAKTCVVCGRFSGFISLLTWTRCCFECMQKAPETQVRTLASLRKLLSLKKAEIGRLRSMKTIPGVYTMDEIPYKSAIAIASLPQAIKLFNKEEHQGLLTQRPPGEMASNPPRKFNFMGSCALSYYERWTDEVEQGMSCAGCQLALEKSIIGSGGERWPFEARDMIYARDEFLAHFRWCQQAQLLWEASDFGTRLPAELPELARARGCFHNTR